jgi:hypothetical protein
MLRGPVWFMQPIPYFGEALTDTWLYEPKIDGWRMQILRWLDGRVELWGAPRNDDADRASRGTTPYCLINHGGFL